MGAASGPGSAQELDALGRTMVTLPSQPELPVPPLASDTVPTSGSSTTTHEGTTTASATQSGVKCNGCSPIVPSRLVSFFPTPLGEGAVLPSEPAEAGAEEPAAVPVVAGPLHPSFAIPGFGLLVGLIAGYLVLRRRRA